MDDIQAAINLINEQGSIFQKHSERLDAIERQAAEIAKKANRPGAPGNDLSMVINDRAEDGFVTLTAADLKSRKAIGARLGIEDEDNPLRVGEFLRAAAGMKTERKGLAEGSDTAGGYAVPRALLPGILSALAPASSMISAGANIVNLDDQAGSFTVAGISSIPTAGWRGERGDIPESDPAFRAINIQPKSLAFYFKVSRELLADSPGLDVALNTVIGQAFAKAIDKAGLLGIGAANEPLGLANTPGINTVNLGIDGTALANYRAFVSAMTAIESGDAPSPTAAIMAPRTYGDLAGLMDTLNQPLRRPEALAAWQLLKSAQVPTDDVVGNSSDCSRLFVGDFRNFSFYMRETMSVQLLKELFAKTGEIGFAAHCRIDAAALYPQAFCVVNGVRPSA